MEPTTPHHPPAISIGPLMVPPPVVLAPMAGVTNYPFRALCRHFGAALFVSEMVTARAHITKVKKKQLLLRGFGRLSFQCRGRIWVDGKEGTFLGYGRIVLLERIRAYGSISQAAKSMEMSYRHAWELVESMNRQAARPLVRAITGGRGGGGVQLTEEGERAVILFWDFYADFQEFLNKKERALGFPESKRTRKREEG